MTSRRPFGLRARLQRLVLVLALIGAGTGAGLIATAPVAAEVPVTIMGSGDIAGPLIDAGSTGDLIRAMNPDAVFTTGDNAYSDGSAAQYATRYDPTWGSFKAKTRPVPGNHDYHTPDAAGYVGYFGAANVTNSSDGGLYYAWDVGNGWRAYAVNTEISTSGAQLAWLQADAAAHAGMNYILYTHHPRYTSGTNHSPSTRICPLWNALAAAGNLEIVIAGHNHNYERFAVMDCAGAASSSGARSFVVGSGGRRLYAFGTPRPGSEFRNNTDFGVLRLVLGSTSYEWSFIASGRGWTGSASVATGRTGQVLDSGTQQTDAAGPPSNRAPSVDAGADSTVTLPATATLNGTVTDDGLPDPPAAVTTSWSASSGPGTVTFADASAVDTTASFSATGAYVLRLSATDGALSASDTTTVTVADGGTPPPPTGGVLDVRVAAGTDDAEENQSGGVTRGSSDLNLTRDGTATMTVGLRFAGVGIPAGATITRAHVQFQADESQSVATNLDIRAQDTANAPAFTTATHDISSRPLTTQKAAWAPPAWSTGQRGSAQQTPDLATVLQPVVSGSGWASGNALVLVVTGTGERTAESYNAGASLAAVLHVEYTT